MSNYEDERAELISLHSDLYKDLTGVRPHRHWNHWEDNDYIQAEIEYISGQLEKERAEEDVTASRPWLTIE